MIQQGINVLLKVGGKFIGGQQNATLNRNQSPINITNRINGNWSEYLSGLKMWSINCSGIYVMDSESYELLEDAFMNDKEIDVELVLYNNTFYGKAIIIDFPLSSGFNSQFKYSLKLLGNGELHK